MSNKFMKNEEATKDSLDEYVSEGIEGIRLSKLYNG